MRLAFFKVDRIQRANPCAIVLLVRQRTHMLLLSDLEDGEVGGLAAPVSVVMIVLVDAFCSAQNADDFDGLVSGSVEHDDFL